MTTRVSALTRGHHRLTSYMTSCTKSLHTPAHVSSIVSLTKRSSCTQPCVDYHSMHTTVFRLSQHAHNRVSTITACTRPCFHYHSMYTAFSIPHVFLLSQHSTCTRPCFHYHRIAVFQLMSPLCRHMIFFAIFCYVRTECFNTLR